MANYRLAQVLVVLAVVKLGLGYGEQGYDAAGGKAESSNENQGASYKSYDAAQAQENDATTYGDAQDAESAYASITGGKSDYGDSAEAAKEELDIAESSQDFAQALNQNTMLGGSAEELGASAYGSQGAGYSEESTTDGDYDQNQPDTSTEDEATSKNEDHKCPLRRKKWVPFERFWFKALPLSSGMSDTYEEAVKKCEKIGGKLMSIHNTATKVFISDQLEKCDINKALTSARLRNGKLEWADDAEDSTVAKGAIKKVKRVKQCLFLKGRKATEKGKYWRGLNCNTDISDVVCMKDYNECASKSTNDGLCPKGFTCPNVESTKCPDRCKNVWGGYKCDCESGYERVTENALTCTDINECTTNKHTCNDGCPCENTKGSYECKDNNECELNTHNCPSGHSCENTHCSFKCNDIDECSANQPCATGCTCTNTVGGYTCQEPNGCDNHQCTALQTCVQNGCTHKCEGKNECRLDEHDCETGCACTDTDTGKGFTCQEPNGCDGDPCGPLQTCVPDGCTHKCEGKDECASGDHDCETGCECTDTDSGKGFTCEEARGCEGNPCGSLQTCVQDGCTHTCTPKNECDLDEHDCGTGCLCTDTNTGKGFTCQEPNGCDGDPCGPLQTCVPDGCTHTCKGKDECATGEHNCATGCTCTDTDTGDGYRCQEPNGCDNHQCTALQTCVQNGCTHTCEFKDECKLDEHDCKTGCACTDTNTGKGFTCQEPNGCDGDPCGPLQTCVPDGCTHKCEGKDECATGEHTCAKGCTCTNTNTGDGYRCQEPNGCDNHQCTALQTCVADGCTHTCEDKDECQLDLHDCGNGCACTDTDTGRGFECEEKDDCNPNPCGTGRQCVNDGCTHNCEDIDECTLDTHDCGSCGCTNTEGSWECDNEDPCTDGTSTCTGDQNCVRTDACRGFRCEDVSQCDAGYEGELCCDINECKNDPCPADEYCTNTDGSHTCSKCADGYKMAANKECVLKSKVIHQTCRQYDDPDGTTNKAQLVNDGDISRTDAKCTIVVPGASHYSWWYVELGGTVTVYGAAIFTRDGDIRLKNFAICTESYIPSSSSDKANMNRSPCQDQCYRMRDESSVAELYKCSNVKNGNNVRIQDHWKGGKLPLCEVEVYTKELPIAYFKNAEMFGVDKSVAMLATDGKNYGPEFWGLGGETCALSAQAATPYFFVDLEKNVDVAGVLITNDPHNWCKKVGYHHAGDDLKYYSGKTYDECRAKCESKAACHGSTSNLVSKGCWLHYVIHDKKVQKKTDHALFIKNCKNKIASKIKNYDVFVKKDKPEFKKAKCGTEEPRNIDELCAYVKERLAGPKKIACDKVINGRYVGIVVRRVPNVDFKIELCTFHVIVGKRAPNDYKTTHRTCKPCDDGTTCGTKTCCTCNEGYDGDDCTNVDECAAGWSKCPTGSSCVDKKDGTYKCEGTTCSSCAEEHECATDGTNDCIRKCTEDPPVAPGIIYGYNMNYDYYYELHQNIATAEACGQVCGKDHNCKAASYLLQYKWCYLQNRLLASKIYFSEAYQTFVKCPKVGEANVDVVFWVTLHRANVNYLDTDDLGWAYCAYSWTFCEETFCPYICRARTDCMSATFASNRYCYFHTKTTQKRIKHYDWHAHYIKRCKEP